MGPKRKSGKTTGKEQKVGFNVIKLITKVNEIQIPKNKATTQGRPGQKTKPEKSKKQTKKSKAGKHEGSQVRNTPWGDGTRSHRNRQLTEIAGSTQTIYTRELGTMDTGETHQMCRQSQRQENGQRQEVESETRHRRT